MLPAVHNDIIDRGSVYRFTTFDVQPDGTPVDYQGCVARLALTPVDGGAPALQLTSSPGGGLTITSAKGRIDVEITTPQTSLLAEEAYAIGLELEWSNGAVELLVEGRVSVRQDRVP